MPLGVPIGGRLSGRDRDSSGERHAWARARKYEKLRPPLRTGTRLLARLGSRAPATVIPARSAARFFPRRALTPVPRSTSQSVAPQSGKTVAVEPTAVFCVMVNIRQGA
jgi:hypothetical protein